MRGNVVNLMDALKRSLSGDEAEEKPARKAPAKKPAAKKRAAR